MLFARKERDGEAGGWRWQRVCGLAGTQSGSSRGLGGETPVPCLPAGLREAGRAGRSGLSSAAVVVLHDSCGTLLRELRDARLGSE